MSVGDGNLTLRVYASSPDPQLVLLIRSVTGGSSSEVDQAVRDGTEMFVARLYAKDHDDIVERMRELWQKAPAFNAIVSVALDGELIDLGELVALTQQWHDIQAQVRQDIERERELA